MKSNSNPTAFRYPHSALVRRHGPAGYADYASYRPWLRDEFSFRCVYCLIRECWGRVTGEFDLDHFIPQAHSPELTTKYDNLLYSCHSCNLRRGNRGIADPTAALIAGALEVQPDGMIETHSDDAERIVRVLALNSPTWVRWRRAWIRIVDLAEEFDGDLFEQLMAYPDELPDLSKLTPPENIRPQGIEQSCFVLRESGVLPSSYVT